MSWSVSGAGPVTADWVYPSWRRLRDGLPTREAAEAWLLRHQCGEYLHYAVSAQPQPRGRAVDHQDSWEMFFSDRYGRMISHRTGRQL
jgi:hypothetical protein